MNSEMAASAPGRRQQGTEQTRFLCNISWGEECVELFWAEISRVRIGGISSPKLGSPGICGFFCSGIGGFFFSGIGGFLFRVFT